MKNNHERCLSTEGFRNIDEQLIQSKSSQECAWASNKPQEGVNKWQHTFRNQTWLLWCCRWLRTPALSSRNPAGAPNFRSECSQPTQRWLQGCGVWTTVWETSEVGGGVWHRALSERPRAWGKGSRGAVERDLPPPGGSLHHTRLWAHGRQGVRDRARWVSILEAFGLEGLNHGSALAQTLKSRQKFYNPIF